MVNDGRPKGWLVQRGVSPCSTYGRDRGKVSHHPPFEHVVLPAADAENFDEHLCWEFIKRGIPGDRSANRRRTHSPVSPPSRPAEESCFYKETNQGSVGTKATTRASTNGCMKKKMKKSCGLQVMCSTYQMELLPKIRFSKGTQTRSVSRRSALSGAWSRSWMMNTTRAIR